MLRSLWFHNLFYWRRQWHPTPALLPGKIPWTEEPGRLQSMGSRRVRHDWATSLSLFTFMHWRGKWQPTPVFLPGDIQGLAEPGGLPAMRSHRVGHDWSDLTAAAAATYSIPLIHTVSSKLGFPFWCVGVLVTQSCLTLCGPMDCSPQGSSVHGILQARILEWVAIPFLRGSFWPKERTQVSCIGR